MKSSSRSSHFKLILSSVFGLTLITGATSLYLSSQDSLNPYQERIFEMSATACHVGILSVFGLLGGKVMSTPSSKNDD